MNVFLIALGSLVLYVLAYRTYGRWLARRIFKLDPAARPPAYHWKITATMYRLRGLSCLAITLPQLQVQGP